VLTASTHTHPHSDTEQKASPSSLAAKVTPSSGLVATTVASASHSENLDFEQLLDQTGGGKP